MTAGREPAAPQEIVARALAAARCDECVVIADETSSANLRWAGNTLTTNGISRSRQLTVIAITRAADGTRAGVVSRAGVRPGQSTSDKHRARSRRLRSSCFTPPADQPSAAPP